jgi:hypothetical protein
LKGIANIGKDRPIIQENPATKGDLFAAANNKKSP